METPRAIVRHLLQQAEDGVTALALTLLRPVAAYFPEWCALTLAAGAGLLVACSPRSLAQHRAFASSRGLDGIAGFLAWARVKSRPFRDCIIVSRILCGREDLGTWDIVEVGAHHIRHLRETGQSFIIATGHFAREACICLYDRRIVPHRVITISAPLPRWSINPSMLKARINSGPMLQAVVCVRPGDSDFAFTGQRDGLANRLIKRLHAPGTVVISAIDAYWAHRGSFTRPFASEASRPLSVGTATIARLSQAPIVPCVPVLLGRRRVAIHWGPVVPPPALDDAAGDERLTNMLLSFLEAAIGRRPDQFVVALDNERHWDATAMRWRTRPGAIAMVQIPDRLEAVRSRIGGGIDTERRL